jgi:hypothetical protein
MRSFLSRALHRLELWLTAVLGPSKDRNSIEPEELPPLDVALVLHSYMLSPHRYFEDATTRFPQLLGMGAFPLTGLADLIDPVTFEYKPTAKQSALWEERTKVAFDHVLFRLNNQVVTIVCPSCEGHFDVLWDSGGFGLGEADFLSTCDLCKCTVTHDRLCVAKFLRCLRAVKESEVSFLPGTLINVRGDFRLARARIIAFEVIKALSDEEGALPLMENVSMAKIATMLRSAPDTKLKSNRIDVLLLPYKRDTPFSHDIARSVMEQQKELNKPLWDRGWCTLEYRSGPCGELEGAYARYCTFLELASHPEHGAIAPTVDIDLLWHTHQLAGPGYRDDMESLLGIYLDHISRHEDMSLWASARESTSRRWIKICEEELANFHSLNSNDPDPECTSMTQDFIDDADDVDDGGNGGRFITN